jgi:hypothetical protein
LCSEEFKEVAALRKLLDKNDIIPFLKDEYNVQTHNMLEELYYGRSLGFSWKLNLVFSSKGDNTFFSIKPLQSSRIPVLFTAKCMMNYVGLTCKSCVNLKGVYDAWVCRLIAARLLHMSRQQNLLWRCLLF